MQDSITMISCVCDDFLQAHGIRDDVQCRWSSAQVMTTLIVAAAHFGSNIDKSRRFLLEHGYITVTLSRSRLNRRLHALPQWLFQGVFGLLSEVFQQHNPSGTYVVDSMPVAVCQKVRIHQCRLFAFVHHESLLGYVASKKGYFYGLRVHLLTTLGGEPVEFVLADGSQADLPVFKQMNLDLPASSRILADKAYNDYREEELLWDAAQIHLMPARKKNLKRQWQPWLAAQITRKRQRIETTFATLSEAAIGRIHAVTPKGFVMKIIANLIAYSFLLLTKVATYVCKYLQRLFAHQRDTFNAAL